MKLSFGKYQGMDIDDVPLDYLVWHVDNSKQTIKEFEAAITRRNAARDASETIVEKIINEGYRQLAKRFHPDAGGSDKQMNELTASKTFLLGLLKKSGAVNA